MKCWIFGQVTFYDPSQSNHFYQRQQLFTHQQFLSPTIFMLRIIDKVNETYWTKPQTKIKMIRSRPPTNKAAPNKQIHSSFRLDQTKLYFKNDQKPEDWHKTLNTSSFTHCPLVAETTFPPLHLQKDNFVLHTILFCFSLFKKHLI